MKNNSKKTQKQVFFEEKDIKSIVQSIIESHYQEKKCLNCSKDISNKNASAKYCDDRCRKNFDNKYKAKKESIITQKKKEAEKEAKRQAREQELYEIKKKQELARLKKIEAETKYHEQFDELEAKMEIELEHNAKMLNEQYEISKRIEEEAKIKKEFLKKEIENLKKLIEGFQVDLSFAEERVISEMNHTVATFKQNIKTAFENSPEYKQFRERYDKEHPSVLNTITQIIQIFSKEQSKNKKALLDKLGSLGSLGRK